MTLNPETTAPLLAQLGNVTRLQIVRLLVKAGNDGLMVGDIQRDLGVPGSTLSHHLSHSSRGKKDETKRNDHDQNGTRGNLMCQK